ncbi:MAG: T9SS type A sorting domain-containing protein, partial [Flavobacteriaceae bacterium]|nr:T9SS type A sorting domain-containing protein [Flavobacteriaceae bacterium]
SISGINIAKNVTVLNITGQQVQYIENADDTIDMSSLQAGVYFMKITTENGFATKKIVKQ